MVRKRSRKGILGVGLDGEDPVVRVTRGENFHLVGGSQQTHEQMQEKCIKFNEKLRQRGKHLEELDHSELLEVASQCQMQFANVRPGPQGPEQGR